MTRLLLVDGDSKSRTANSEAMVFAGYTADTAGTGAEALALLAVFRYDCIITDTDLPDMDGVLLCQKARLVTQAPLLFLSESEDAELRIRAFMAECDGFLKKPCSGRELSVWVGVKVSKFKGEPCGVRDG